MQRKTTWFRILRLMLYLLLFLFFALLPYSAAENGIFLCPSAAMGFSCPGCGVTRAMTLLMKGRFAEAWGMNPVFCGILFPGALLTALQDIYVTVSGKKLSFLEYIAGWNGGTLGGA